MQTARRLVQASLSTEPCLACSPLSAPSGPLLAGRDRSPGTESVCRSCLSSHIRSSTGERLHVGLWGRTDADLCDVRSCCDSVGGCGCDCGSGADFVEFEIHPGQVLTDDPYVPWRCRDDGRVACGLMLLPTAHAQLRAPSFACGARLVPPCGWMVSMGSTHLFWRDPSLSPSQFVARNGCAHPSN